MIMIIVRFSKNLKSRDGSPYSFPSLSRRFSLWSMKKDPDLESALYHNRRWIVNNQIKNMILRYPNQTVPVNFLQKKFKTLDLQGRALNWLNKYPCCFEVFQENGEHYCRLTKRMLCLVEEEESVKKEQELVFAERLAKILMMSWNKRVNVVKLDELKRSLGFPDDYLLRILPKHPEMFRLVNHSGRKSALEVELVSWKPELAISHLEISAHKQNIEPCFSCSLPLTWAKSWERFNEFNSTPYVSPYVDPSGLFEGSKEKEKRTVALVHELLSLTLWKKMSIVKLGHFKRELALPEKLNVFLLHHPGIFYVSNKYKSYTVLLRDGYRGSELVQRDSLVIVKDKFGELMQEGLHEYNQRRRLLNLEKRKKGIIVPKLEKRKDKNAEMSEEEDQVSRVGLFDPEERKRFYKILFDEDP
uniref:PORR domain-containing protein n=1 Tax=Opuntia streptacantha TaxID=393608 RepID=A0A7C9E5Q6_OPUST